MDVVAVRVGRRGAAIGRIGHGQPMAVRVIAIGLRGDDPAAVALLLLRNLVAKAEIQYGF